MASYGSVPAASTPLVSHRSAGHSVHSDETTRGRVLRAVGVAGALMLTAAAYAGRISSITSADLAVASASTLSASASALSDIEAAFVDGIDPDRIRTHLHKYSSVPHSAGTAQDYETVLYTKQQFESFGIEAEIKEYYTLLSKPVRQRLAILEPGSAARELNLTEASVEGDACTSDESALPPFLAYAATGNVTGSIVYVNFGKPEDFQWLLDHNVTLKGKIALVRYGGNFRGLKVMGAEEHGMIGTLIYSDPKDDGFVQGPVYPDGPWRPENSFQRGSSQYLSLAGGDPLTPGFPSVKGAPYLKYEDTKTIPHTPALPLSYGQAKYILASLGGLRAPDNWQGGLSFPGGYSIGSDEKTVVNLDIEIDNHVGAIWDVIGKIPGSEEPDQQVLLGNHRDAWVCGAIDPNSGSSVLLELANGLGKLLKTGWKPRRTIVLASWDGEEYGLLGSTEYAEDNEATLKKQAVAYLNVDGFTGSLVSASASPSIAEFLFQTAKAVPANKFKGDETESSLYEQWIKQADARRARVGHDLANTLGPDHLISFMGSGSDFTPYYQHLGIISANLGFELTDGPTGVYHSSMDSINFSEKFADPRYATHVTAARWWGLLGLRLADADVLPFDFSTYGLVMREDLAGFEQQIRISGKPVDFSTLYNSIAFFGESAARFHKQLEVVDGTNTAIWNEKLVLLERNLLLDEGLPHRPWYKHVIFGPGFYEGYAGTAFPGISDAIAFDDDAETIQKHVDDVAAVVRRAAEFLL